MKKHERVLTYEFKVAHYFLSFLCSSTFQSYFIYQHQKLKLIPLNELQLQCHSKPFTYKNKYDQKQNIQHI